MLKVTCTETMSPHCCDLQI